MEEMQERQDGARGKMMSMAGRLPGFAHRMLDRLVSAGEEDFRVLKREAGLFFGIVLTLVGLMNFQNGKNCDGNTADYLSCTRPSTFYYFGWIEIVLVLVGAFFIVLWFLKRRQK